MAEIPEDDDKCSAWLHKLYQEKVSGPGQGQEGLLPAGGEDAASYDS